VDKRSVASIDFFFRRSDFHTPSARRMLEFQIPPFRPHALFRGGHAQTIAGAYWPYRRPRYRARHHIVALPDGDQLVLHDDCPPNWKPTDRTALLIHGLAGCHESGYMVRIAHKLHARGVRSLRMDLRGCGAGMSLARLPYHSGRSEDAAAALESIARHLPQSPTTLVGFSLGANITLKLLGELGDRPCGNLDSAMAVCSRQISQASNRIYDRFFVGLLLKHVAERRRVLPQLAHTAFSAIPRTLWEFDNSFTAVVCGFGTADNYYRQASSAPWIPKIRIPTLILASRDDPMIPCDALANSPGSPSVQVHMAESGGHLGFVARGGADPDRRWMEWRVIDWITLQCRIRQRALTSSS
jgi:predicted alpha/beta-fold hydrolase